MVSLSVVRTSPDRPPVTASVWHRPVVSEEAKDRLAERQARAAVALVRLGQGERGLAALAAQPRPPAEELHHQLAESSGCRSESDRRRARPQRWAAPELLARVPDPAQSTDRRSPASGVAADSGRPSVPRTGRTACCRVAANGDLGPRRAGSGDPPTPLPQLMEAILFHPETSIRRALILALGTYGPDGLSPGEREPLIARLLALYENDPDAGIHGAAAWTLGQWQQQAKLEEI